jgi:hypothetical protein
MERVASDGGDSRSASRTRERREDGRVSVSQLLTNVVVLQEFMLELAALIQGRVGVFGEVRFV